MSTKLDTGALMALIRHRELDRKDSLYKDYTAKKFVLPDTLERLREKLHLYPYFEQLITVRHSLFIKEITNLVEKEKSLVQIVSIGAGYCPLINDILSKNSKLFGFEVDKKSVLDFKIKCTDGNYLPRPISCDLENESDVFVEKLIENGFNKKLQTLIFMEGLLYYLPNLKVIDGLFQKISALCSESSFLLFDMQLGNNNYGEQEKDLANVFYRLSVWNEMLNKRGFSLLKFGNIAFLDEWDRLSEFKGDVLSGFFLSAKYGDKIS